MHRFEAELWPHHGGGGWHFVTLPRRLSEEIRAGSDDARPGFGSIRVRVTVGKTTWSTSIFPDAKAGTYVLPVKREVRRAEGIEAGDPVRLALEVLD